NLRVSALNSGVCLILVFLVVIVHLVSDCTHLTRCPKLLVRIKRYPEEFKIVVVKQITEKLIVWLMPQLLRDNYQSMSRRGNSWDNKPYGETI
ncbi:hypothetical protein, partial [Vibrio fluvialis]